MTLETLNEAQVHQLGLNMLNCDCQGAQQSRKGVGTVQICDACLGVIAQAQVLISCSVMRAYMVQHVAEINRSRKFLVCFTYTSFGPQDQYLGARVRS